MYNFNFIKNKYDSAYILKGTLGEQYRIYNIKLLQYILSRKSYHGYFFFDFNIENKNITSLYEYFYVTDVESYNNTINSILKDISNGVRFHIYNEKYPNMFHGMSGDTGCSILNLLIKNNIKMAYFLYSININKRLPTLRVKRNKRKSCFRYMRTFNENKQNSLHISEHGQNIVRGKRRRLPDHNDDYMRSDYSNHCWKNKKIKRQYMKNL